tara:strand:+ start:299 stop:466 length:168 start_codon:yes stop_codon:yes gene_type:complete
VPPKNNIQLLEDEDSSDDEIFSKFKGIESQAHINKLAQQTRPKADGAAVLHKPKV